MKITMKTCSPRLAVALMAVLLASAAGKLPAAEPDPQLRYFALILPDRSTPDDIPEFCPDLEAPDSKLLVVHPTSDRDNPAAASSAMIFMSSSARMSGEPPEPVEPCTFDGISYPPGEIWVRSRAVTHVSGDGNETVTLIWKDELPPPGAVALTGPMDDAGQALFFDWFWIRPGDSGDTDSPLCDPWNNRWFASRERTGGASFLVCIGVGLFSK